MWSITCSSPDHLACSRSGLLAVHADLYHPALVSRMEGGLGVHGTSSGAMSNPLPRRRVLIKERPAGTPTCREKRNLFQKLARFLSQSLENPRLGSNDRVLAHPEFRGHLRRRNAIEREPAECLPGCGAEIRLDHRQELLDDVLVMLAVPFAGEVAVRVSQSVQKPLCRIEPDDKSPLPSISAHPVDRNLS